MVESAHSGIESGITGTELLAALGLDRKDVESLFAATRGGDGSQIRRSRRSTPDMRSRAASRPASCADAAPRSGRFFEFNRRRVAEEARLRLIGAGLLQFNRTELAGAVAGARRHGPDRCIARVVEMGS
jgi:hypothetical protein